MRQEGEFQVSKDQSSVLSFLSDAKSVAECIPDLQELKEEEGGQVSVKVKVGVGFLKGTMNIRLQSEQQGSNVRFHGNGKGLNSVVDIDAGFAVSEAGPNECTVKWDGDAQVKGTLASMASGLLTPIQEKNIRDLVAGIQQTLSK